MADPKEEGARLEHCALQAQRLDEFCVPPPTHPQDRQDEVQPRLVFTSGVSGRAVGMLGGRICVVDMAEMDGWVDVISDEAGLVCFNSLERS